MASARAEPPLAITPLMPSGEYEALIMYLAMVRSSCGWRTEHPSGCLLRGIKSRVPNDGHKGPGAKPDRTPLTIIAKGVQTADACSRHGTTSTVERAAETQVVMNLDGGHRGPARPTTQRARGSG